jgi:hypothetical protein
MNRTELRNEANRRIFEIEEAYGERDLPRSVLSYYLLLRAVYLGDLEEYQNEYGHQFLHTDVVEEGKMKLGWGQLTEFEAGICEILNGQLDLDGNEVSAPIPRRVGIRA